LDYIDQIVVGVILAEKEKGILPIFVLAIDLDAVPDKQIDNFKQVFPGIMAAKE
jgi:hypothetical protein